MMALVWGGTLNSSAANLSTAVKGAASGTLNLREFRASGRWGAPDQGSGSGSGPGPATRAIEVEGGIRSVGARAGYSHFEGELGVGGEDDLEGHLPSSARRAAARRRHGLPRREASRLA